MGDTNTFSPELLDVALHEHLLQCRIYEQETPLLTTEEKQALTEFHEYIAERVRRMFTPSLAQSDNPELSPETFFNQLEFHYCDDPHPNAAILKETPDGKSHVFVTKGLLEQCENEDQLMAVIGHEIGHRIQEILNPDKKNNKAEELTSDAIGISHLINAGYRPQQYVRIIEKLSPVAQQQSLAQKLAQTADVHPVNETRLTGVKAALQKAEVSLSMVEDKTTPLNLSIINPVLALNKMGKKLPMDLDRIKTLDTDALTETLTGIRDLQRTIYADTDLPNNVFDDVWGFIIGEYQSGRNQNEYNIQLRDQGDQQKHRVINSLYAQKIEDFSGIPDFQLLLEPTWDLMQPLYGDDTAHNMGFQIHAAVLNSMTARQTNWLADEESLGYADPENITLPQEIQTARRYIQDLLEHPEKLTAESLQDERLTKVVTRLRQLNKTDFFYLPHAQRLLNPFPRMRAGNAHPCAKFVEYFIPRTDEESATVFDANGTFNTPQHLLLTTIGVYDTRLFVRSNKDIARNNNPDWSTDAHHPSVRTLIRPDIVAKAPSNIQRAADVTQYGTVHGLRILSGECLNEYTYDQENQITSHRAGGGILSSGSEIKKRLSLRGDFIEISSQQPQILEKHVQEYFPEWAPICQSYQHTWGEKTKPLTQLHQDIRRRLNMLETRPIDMDLLQDVMKLRKWLKSTSTGDDTLDFRAGTELPFVPKGLDCLHQVGNNPPKATDPTLLPSQTYNYELFDFTDTTLMREQLSAAYLRIGQKIAQDKAFAAQHPEMVEALTNNPDFWDIGHLGGPSGDKPPFREIYTNKYATHFHRLWEQEPFITALSPEQYLATHTYEDIAAARLSGSFRLLTRVIPEYRKPETPADLLHLADVVDNLKAQVDALGDKDKKLSPEEEKSLKQRYDNLLALTRAEIYSWAKEDRTDIPARVIAFLDTSPHRFTDTSSWPPREKFDLQTMDESLGRTKTDSQFFPIEIPIQAGNTLQQTLFANLTERANWPTDLETRMRLLSDYSARILDVDKETIAADFFPDFIAEYRAALSQASGPKKAQMAEWVWLENQEYEQRLADGLSEIWQKATEKKELKFERLQTGLSIKATEDLLSLTATPNVWDGAKQDNVELYLKLTQRNAFPLDDELRQKVIKHLIAQIQKETVEKQEELSFALLTTAGKVFSPTNRDTLVSIWVESVYKQVGGIDDKSPAYAAKVKPFIDKLHYGAFLGHDTSEKKGLSKENSFILSTALQEKLVSQYALSKELKSNYESSYIEYFSKHSEQHHQGLGAGIDALFTLCGENPKLCGGVIDFLLQPRTPQSTQALFDLLKSESRIELPGHLPLVYAYDNFWSKPFEFRTLLLNSLFEQKYEKTVETEIKRHSENLPPELIVPDSSSQEERTQLKAKKQAYLKGIEEKVKTEIIAKKTEDILNRILPADMPNRGIFRLALKNFAEAVDEDESYRTEFLLTGCLTAAPKITEQYATEQEAQQAAEKNIASIIRLFLEAQGPAGIKVGQFISAQSEVPAYIREELTHLTNHAAKPSRIEAFEILEKYHPEVLETVKAGKMGRLLGSASHYLTYDFEDPEPDTSKRARVLSFARNQSELKANVVYKRLLRALNTTLKNIEENDSAATKQSPNTQTYGVATANIPDSAATKQMLHIIKDAVTQAYGMNTTELNGNIGYQQMAEARKLYDCVGMEIDGFTIDFETMKWDINQPGKYRTITIDGRTVWSQSCRIMEKANGDDYDKITDEKVKIAVAKANFMLNLRAILKGGLFDDDRHAGQLKVEQIGNRLLVGLFDTGSMSTELPTQRERKLLGHVFARTIRGVLLAQTSPAEKKEGLERLFPNTNFQTLLANGKNPSFTDCFNAALHEVRCKTGEMPPYLSKVMRALGQLSHFTKDIPAEDNIGITKLALRMISEKNIVHPDILAGMGMAPTPQSDIGKAIKDLLYKTGNLNIEQKRLYLNTLAEMITAPSRENPALRISAALRGVDANVRRQIQHNCSALIKTVYHALNSGQTPGQITNDIIKTLKETPLPARLINNVALGLPKLSGLTVRAAFAFGNKLNLGTPAIEKFITERIASYVNQWAGFKDITYRTDKVVEDLPTRKLSSRKQKETGHAGQKALKIAAIVQKGQSN